MHHLINNDNSTTSATPSIGTPMTTHVVVVVPLYNRGKFLTSLLGNLKQTQDPHWSMFVSDSGSDDVNLAQLKNDDPLFDYIQNTCENFVIGKASDDGCRAAASKFPDAIVYLTDVDIRYPMDVFRRIRSHTRSGSAFYAPIVSLEKRDGTLYGEREDDHQGGGQIGVFARDFIKSGGWQDSKYMNFGRWGGQDSHFRNVLKTHGLKEQRIPSYDMVSQWHPREHTWYDTGRADKGHMWW
jgi:glycosyltransferase involved in cell wall biosynthesis